MIYYSSKLNSGRSEHLATLEPIGIKFYFEWLKCRRENLRAWTLLLHGIIHIRQYLRFSFHRYKLWPIRIFVFCSLCRWAVGLLLISCRLVSFYSFNSPKFRAFVNTVEGISDSNRAPYITVPLQVNTVIARYMCSPSNVARNGFLMYDVRMWGLCPQSDEKVDGTWSSFFHTQLCLASSQICRKHSEYYLELCKHSWNIPKMFQKNCRTWEDYCKLSRNLLQNV